MIEVKKTNENKELLIEISIIENHSPLRISYQERVKGKLNKHKQGDHFLLNCFLWKTISRFSELVRE